MLGWLSHAGRRGEAGRSRYSFVPDIHPEDGVMAPSFSTLTLSLASFAFLTLDTGAGDRTSRENVACSSLTGSFRANTETGALLDQIETAEFRRRHLNLYLCEAGYVARF